MWIKLHFYHSGDEVAVQAQNICFVCPDQREQYDGVTCIQFNGAEENYIKVKESVDEIGRMITE